MEIPVTAKSREYTPEWRGNQDDPNPIRVTLRYLNTAQRTQLMPWRPDEKGSVRMEPDQRQLLIAGVEKVENCVVIQDGMRKDIRDGRDILAAYGLEGLAIELVAQIISMNAQEDVEKNF